jgi:hypothetical protein
MKGRLLAAGVCHTSSATLLLAPTSATHLAPKASRHSELCISIQPQIIPTASSADRAVPGPSGRGITWFYAGSYKRTSENLEF